MKKFISIATMASTVVMMAGLTFMPMQTSAADNDPPCSAPVVTNIYDIQAVGGIAIYKFTLAGDSTVYQVTTSTVYATGTSVPDGYAFTASWYGEKRVDQLQGSLHQGVYTVTSMRAGAPSCSTPTPTPEGMVCTVSAQAALGAPYATGFSVDSNGSVWVSTSRSLQKFSPSGSLLVSLSAPQLYEMGITQDIHAIATDQAGNVYVNSGWTVDIAQLSPTGEFIHQFTALNGYIAMDVANDEIYVGGIDVVRAYSPSGTVLRTVTLANQGQISNLAVADSGRMFIRNGAGVIVSFNPSGSLVKDSGISGNIVTINRATGHVFTAAYPGDGTIKELDEDLNLVSTWYAGNESVGYGLAYGFAAAGTHLYFWDGSSSVKFTDCSAGPFPTPTPPGTVIEEIVNGKLKLEPGDKVVLGPPTVVNGGLEGTSGNMVTVRNGYVRVDGSVKLLDTLVIEGGSTLEISGGLEITGTLTIKQGGSLIVGGKFTCPGASTVIDEGHQTLDIGNNQCIQLASKGGGLGIGGILAVIGLSLVAGLGFGVYMKTRGK